MPIPLQWILIAYNIKKYLCSRLMESSKEIFIFGDDYYGGGGMGEGGGTVIVTIIIYRHIKNLFLTLIPFPF